MFDLKPFCSTDPVRPYLHAPFTQDGHTYATNGHILVRVAERPGVPPPPENKPRADKLFDKEWREPTMALPAFELPKEEFNDCERCDGLKSNYHDCECCTCVCEKCNEDGKVSSLTGVSVGICGAIFAAKYAKMLQALPGIRVAAPKSGYDPMPFSFDGGDGIVMPLKESLMTHIEAQELSSAQPAE